MTWQSIIHNPSKNKCYLKNWMEIVSRSKNPKNGLGHLSFWEMAEHVNIHTYKIEVNASISPRERWKNTCLWYKKKICQIYTADLVINICQMC